MNVTINAKKVDQMVNVTPQPTITFSQFRHVLRVSEGTAKYCDMMSDRFMSMQTWFQTRHPISSDLIDNGYQIVLIGDSTSASVGAWQRTIVERYANSILGMIPFEFMVWRLPIQGSGEKHDIYVECRLAYPPKAGEEAMCQESYMVGGMTNYSGESGSAWSMVREFMAAFVAIHPQCPITERVYRGDTKAIHQEIATEINRQRSEEDNEVS